MNKDYFELLIFSLGIVSRLSVSLKKYQINIKFGHLEN